MQTTWGRGREINRSISASSSAAGLSRGHDVSSPPACLPRTRLSSRAGLTQTQQIALVCSTRATALKTLLPHNEPAGGSAARAGPVRSSDPGAVQVLALLAWSWRVACVFQDPLPTPKTAASCF